MIVSILPFVRNERQGKTCRQVFVQVVVDRDRLQITELKRLFRPDPRQETAQVWKNVAG